MSYALRALDPETTMIESTEHLQPDELQAIKDRLTPGEQSRVIGWKLVAR